MSAADRYGELVLAHERQQAEYSSPLTEARWAKYAPSYRFNPHREPEPQLAAALEYVQPEDEILEVGGGAGRMGLPLVLRGQSLLNVEPSAAMRRQFEICIEEHRIANARALASRWPTPESLSADLVLTVDVTYFISEIEPFLRAMDESARRRAMILTWTVPPPNVNADLFRLAFGVEQAPSPGFHDLLPVLWEMGIVPDVRVFDEQFTWPERLPTDEQSAVRFALAELEPGDEALVRDRVAAALAELYQREEEQWRPTWRTPSRAMLITWRTGAAA